MKKRLPAIFLALLLVPVLLLPAFADVMWEPYGNSFYERHADDCQYENRSYLTNGDEGYVTFYSAPGSKTEEFNLPNGTSVYIGFTYDHDGVLWAVGEYGEKNEDGYTWHDGWAPMPELAELYDSQCFEEDHADEFEPASGNAAELNEIMFYSYPGGILQTSVPMDVSGSDWAEYDFIYTDENGLRWSMFGYFCGLRNVWFCLDDPASGTLGIDAPRAAAEVRQTGETLTPAVASIPAARSTPLWVYPAVLIAAAALVTAIVVGIRARKKRGA